VRELSKALDAIIAEYDRWVVLKQKDRPLIPFEKITIKTFLMYTYHTD
jgi:hypothetical protein